MSSTTFHQYLSEWIKQDSHFAQLQQQLIDNGWEPEEVTREALSCLSRHYTFFHTADVKKPAFLAGILRRHAVVQEHVQQAREKRDREARQRQELEQLKQRQAAARKKAEKEAARKAQEEAAKKAAQQQAEQAAAEAASPAVVMSRQFLPQWMLQPFTKHHKRTTKHKNMRRICAEFADIRSCWYGDNARHHDYEDETHHFRQGRVVQTIVDPIMRAIHEGHGTIQRSPHELMVHEKNANISGPKAQRCRKLYLREKNAKGKTMYQRLQEFINIVDVTQLPAGFVQASMCARVFLDNMNIDKHKAACKFTFDENIVPVSHGESSRLTPTGKLRKR